MATVLDVWTDDISADVEHFDPQIAARRAYKLYLMRLRRAPELSTPKSLTTPHTLGSSAPRSFLSAAAALGSEHVKADFLKFRRSSLAGNNPLKSDKAAARNSKLQKLAVPTRKIAVRVNRVGVQTTATWGHQAQGLAPKRMKVIRAAAGGHAFRQSLGSLDLVFDLGEFSLQDPAERVLLEHWITFAAFIPSLSKEVFLKS